MLQRDLGLRAARIDGAVSRAGRVAAMAAFNSPDPETPSVMLASLMAAGVGINLLGACVKAFLLVFWQNSNFFFFQHVILADPWWNPSVENQAMDRVHRIGQTETVTVYRLVIAGSLEERMVRSDLFCFCLTPVKKLDIHDAKNALADAALSLKSPEELKRLNIERLSKLFGAASHVRGKRGRLDKNAPLLPGCSTHNY